MLYFKAFVDMSALVFHMEHLMPAEQSSGVDTAAAVHTELRGAFTILTGRIAGDWV